jgi:hypothetical protein
VFRYRRPTLGPTPGPSISGGEDGFVNPLDAVFEAKFMLPWSFSEEAAPEKHMAQLQHTMWVTKARSAALSIITGGRKWIEMNVPADALNRHFLDAWTAAEHERLPATCSLFDAVRANLGRKPREIWTARTVRPDAAGACARQMRCTELTLTLTALAIAAPVQCVSSLGGASMVSATPRSASERIELGDARGLRLIVQKCIHSLPAPDAGPQLAALSHDRVRPKPFSAASRSAPSTRAFPAPCGP